MQYASLVAISARSAIRTARFSLRVSRRHSRKAWAWYYGAFLSPEVTARYQEVGRILGAIACVAIALVQIAGIYADAYVESCLEQPTTEPEQPLLPAAAPMLALPPAKEPAPAPAKKRGRPRKNPAPAPASAAPKRKPGRPRKAAAPAPVGA